MIISIGYENETQSRLYLNYPEDHSCSNWLSDKWNKIINSLNAKNIYNEKNILGVIFKEEDDYFEEVSINDVDQIARKIMDLIYVINSAN